MNKLKKILQTLSLAVLASVTFLVPSAFAQDAASLEALVMDWYEKLNSEDTGYGVYLHDEETLFPRTGSLLEGGESFNVEDAQAGFDAGLNFDVQVRHLEAKVYGTTGVATYYTTGPTAYPDGSVLRGVFRASMIATFEGNRWRVVHIHISPLQSSPED